MRHCLSSHQSIEKINLKRRQETTLNGVSVKVLKSGLQKYVRRGMLSKGLWCLAELDLLSLVEDGGDGTDEYVRLYIKPSETVNMARRSAIQRAKALRTNVLNRLIVMVPEEISIACWWMPIVVNRLAEAWKSERCDVQSRQHLVEIYKLLCASKKIRLISDLKSVYLLPPDYVKPQQRQELSEIHAEAVKSLEIQALYENCHSVPTNLVDHCRVDLRPFGNVADADFRQIVNGLLHNLRCESDHVFYWVNRLIEQQRDAKGNPCFRGKRNKINLVWALLEGFAKHRELLWGETPQAYPNQFHRLAEVLSVLREWYTTMTNRETPTYLYHAILLVVRRRQVDWRSEPEFPITNRHEVEALYDANLNGDLIELDSFVHDMHTGTHGPDKRTRFANEGAWVENEETSLRNESYRSLYHRLKERLDSSEEDGWDAPKEMGGNHDREVG